MIEDLPEYKERSVVEQKEPAYTLNVTGGRCVVPQAVLEKFPDTNGSIGFPQPFSGNPTVDSNDLGTGSLW